MVGRVSTLKSEMNALYGGTMQEKENCALEKDMLMGKLEVAKDVRWTRLSLRMERDDLICDERE